MSPREAKKIIESLANGIDSRTGEILPDENPFNNPNVVHALFVALKALDHAAKREQRDNSLPDNAGKSWSDEEDQVLLAAFDAELPIKEIARKHARTEGAIAARLVRLGRIKERADVYARP